MVQSHPLSGLQRGRFAGLPVHSRKPPLPYDLRFRDVLEIRDCEKVIRESVEVYCEIRVAPSRPPQAIDAKAGHFKECDFLHFCGP